MLRVEDKYNLSKIDMYMCEKRIASCLATDTYSKNGGYTISSLYFDDFEHHCLEDTINGVSHRNKYRIRIYNHSLDLIKLEVKTKIYNRTQKFSSIISEIEMKELISGNCIKSENSSNDARYLFNKAISTNIIRPEIVVEYERNAYISDLGNVRITFDCNVRWSDDTDLFGNRIGTCISLPDSNSVLEVKYDQYIPQYISQLLETNNMIQTSNSKYALCMKKKVGYVS